MEQKRIRTLLEEAARAGCERKRQREILDELLAAAPAITSGNIPGSIGNIGVHVVLSKLFVDAATNRPIHLPLLFPVFALVCGDHPNSILADIDWSLVK